MLNKLFLFALVVCAFSNAAMIGDFAPMKVGNKWVYSDTERWSNGGYSFEGNYLRIITITSTNQKGDSVFYSVTDSTFDSISPQTINKLKYLEINGKSFVYDSSSKKYIDSLKPFFEFHQFQDTILKKVTFNNQSLFCCSLSLGSPNCVPYTYSYCNWDNRKWIQNFGLFYWSQGNNAEGRQPQQSSEIKLKFFNDQPVDSLISAIALKNIAFSSNRIQLIFNDTRSQIHWRGLSGADHLGVQLFDCRGRLLLSSSQLPGTYILNASQFPSGAYILRYRVNNDIWKHFSFARN